MTLGQYEHCTAPPEVVRDVMSRLINYVFADLALPAPKLICQFENAEQVQFMIGHRPCDQAVLLELQCAGIGFQTSFRGDSMWVGMVIKRFDIGNLMFDVPSHIDLHITLAYMKRKLMADDMARFRKCMERQLRNFF